MVATVTPTTPATETTDWYRLSAEDVCRQLDVDAAAGLSTAEVVERRQRYGSNKLAEEAKEPGWRAFLRQYRDLMQLVLLGAAVVSIVALQDVSTGLVVIGLTVVNALMGLHQEGKAAESVAALRQMLIMTASVRRDGQLVAIPAEELVPGDIVGFQAGDKVPADGRILVAATLEIEEAGLTGESTPSAKSLDPVTGEDVPLGDRVDMAYMNSQVTRGRGEMVVTATGMSTEVGHISGMLSGVEQEKTPLTKQLDQLTVIITIMAAAALVLIIILGLARGEDFDSLFLTGITLAIAAIPTGLPAVVTMLLSMGTRQLAEQGAIVKRLKSVETLGSTSAICSDKTGTLTLNQMTVRELVLVGRRFAVDGEGYSTTGRVLHVAGEGDTPLEPFMLPMALANDAVIRDGACIGDPTEGALVVLAAKGGLDVEDTRQTYPRVAEVPFDAEYKLMATFHEMEEDGHRVVRCFVKGAPDVLLARSSRYLDVDGSPKPMTPDAADRVARRERPARRRGPARPRRRPTRLRSRHLRSGRRSPGGGREPRPARPRRHRRPAPQGGEGRHRPLQGRRHPRPHDHRRPRDDRRGDRRTTRHRGAGAHRRRVRRPLRRPAPRRRRRHRRRRPRRARGQGSPGQHPQGTGKHRRHDGRRRERRSCADQGGHRRGDGDHGHRGDQGRRRDDPHRRQLRHDRHRRRGRSRALRQLDEVRPGPDDHAGRVHPAVRRGGHLRDRQRHTAPAAADPVDQLRHRCVARLRTRIRRTDPRVDAATPPITRPNR